MATSPPPEISVVVPVRDGEREIPKLLASLAAQTLPAERFEVVIVDNGSRDATAAVARQLGAQVVEEPRPSRSRARNLGVEAARADLIAFTDADCVAQPDWLEALSAALARWPLVGGEMRVTMSEDPVLVERLEALWRFRGNERRVLEEHWAPSANLGVTKPAFERIGGFDPSFWARGEDVDFCLRADDAGLELGWCPTAVVEHPVERDVQAMLRRAMSHGYSDTKHLRRFEGRIGSRAWLHPGPLVRGDFALRRFGDHVDGVAPGDLRQMLRLAKAEYAAQMAGSFWAEITRSR